MKLNIKGSLWVIGFGVALLASILLAHAQVDHARIKLVAGDVSKLAPGNPFARSDGTHMGTGQAVLAEAPASSPSPRLG